MSLGNTISYIVSSKLEKYGNEYSTLHNLSFLHYLKLIETNIIYRLKLSYVT